MIYKGNRTNYGETIGILMMNSHFPRIPGDIGNATTFPFPVRYEIVQDACIDTVVTAHEQQTLESMIAGARRLERQGVRAITGSCGFLAIWQKEIASAVSIPVLMSSMLQIPYAHAITGKPVGVVTAQAENMTRAHLEAVNAGHVPVVIRGMEPAPEFHKVFTHNGLELDTALVEAELAQVVERMVSEFPEIGSIVLECSNLPPYAKRVAEVTKLPVFDLVTMVKYVHSALVREPFCGYL